MLPARAASLRDHPRFRPALAVYCSGMAQTSPVAWPVYKLFDQLGRYFVCYMLIHNYYAWRHGGGPAPTLAALQRVAGSSERRTAGLVAALKAGQFVSVEDDPADRWQKLLRPAPAMVMEIGRSVRLFIVALDAVDGRPPAHAAQFGDADRLGDVLQRSAAQVLAHGTLLHGFSTVLHFAERDCGYPLLCAVMGAHYAATLPGAPAGVPLTMRALAQRFQVSPAHIGNLLGEAERRGWLSIAASRLTVSAALVDEFEAWAAAQMAHYGELAGETRKLLDL